jgi:hypothetical protein
MGFVPWETWGWPVFQWGTTQTKVYTGAPYFVWGHAAGNFCLVKMYQHARSKHHSSPHKWLLISRPLSLSSPPLGFCAGSLPKCPQDGIIGDAYLGYRNIGPNSH